MCLHDHSNDFRKLFSVTDHGQTIAIMKPSAQLSGWWILEGRGIEWLNPLARDISEVRKQAGKDEWPSDATGSLYNNSAAFMLVKGKRAALNEMRALAEQCCKSTPPLSP